MFLTWPLSGFAVYLLVLRLSRRYDAAFVAGLAFAFAPYRVSQMAHIQVLSCYWLPVALLSLHAYLQDRRHHWLVLFGTAWLLQSLSNGYFMLFGAVLIGLWLAYFCSTRTSWRRLPPIAATWIAATIPLVPVFLNYQRVHAQFGLQRSYEEVVMYSAQPAAWGHVSDLVWFWSLWLRDAGGEGNLFPGMTAVLLVVVAVVAFLRRRGQEDQAAPPVESRRLRLTRIALGTVVALAVALTVVTLIAGPWRIGFAGITFRMRGIDRAVAIAIACGIALLLAGGIPRPLARRSPFVFYAAATLAMTACSMGPEIRSGTSVLVESAPYRWLMWLPGFTGLRVVARFWTVGTLSLAIAAGLAFARLRPNARTARALLFVLTAGGLLLDGWIRQMPMASRPEHWPRAERRDQPRPIIELPLGPEWDAAATFRAVRHRRRVANGVSGYDPPHYGILQRGLRDRDPSVLTALASFGPMDVVVNGTADPGGALARYVAAIPGVQRSQDDGVRTVFQLPDLRGPEVGAGVQLPIRAVGAQGARQDLSVLFDGDVGTSWAEDPLHPVPAIELDLGTPREVGGIVHVAGADAETFPRRLAIEASRDGVSWREAWEGTTVGAVVLAGIRGPREWPIALPIEPETARFIRLHRLNLGSRWVLAELRVYAPVRKRP